jgi:hypothetical protein
MRFNADNSVRRIPILGALIRKVGFVIFFVVVLGVVLKFSGAIKNIVAKWPVVGKFFGETEV